MYYYVIGVLLFTAIAFFLVPKVKWVMERIQQTKFKTLKTMFWSFALLFIIITMIVARNTSDSLNFVGVDEFYAEGCWALMYAIVLYFLLFQEFHLNSFIVSKEIEWNEVTEEILIRVMKLSALFVLENNMDDKDVTFIFKTVTEYFNRFSANTVIVENALALHDDDEEKKVTIAATTFVIRDARIRDVYKFILDLIELKNN